MFVHGWCSDLTTWDHQLRSQASDHRVVALDRRGHGRSDPSRSGYAVEVHAGDLAALLDHTATDHAVVIAHAGGVPAALVLARDRPDLVRALVLVEASLGSGAARSGLRRLVAAVRGADGSAVLERTYRSFFTTLAGDDAIATARAMPIEVAADELAGLAIDSEALARSVRQPVWWVSVGPADHERIGSLFDAVEIVELGGAGHFPQVEAAAAVDGVLAEVIAALRR